MSHFNTIRMLVADDSSTVQRFFKDVVAMAPMPLELVTADTGLECMNLLDQGGIDLAFIDVHMPEMSGMEAVGRARFKGNKTFVTLMSSKSDPRRLQVARQIHAYEYLVKPFTAADILAILKTYQIVAKLTRTLIVDDSRTIRQALQPDDTLLIKQEHPDAKLRAKVEEAVRRCPRQAPALVDA